MTTPLVGTHTLLNDYENCPRKANERYIKKSIPYVETPQMAWGNVVHKSCERRLTSGVPLPPDVQHLEGICKALEAVGKVQGELQVAVNKNWEPCTFKADDVWFRGKIDVPIILDQKRAFIIDWKTGKEREDPTELHRHAALWYSRLPTLVEIKAFYVWEQKSALGKMHPIDMGTVAGARMEINGIMAHIQQAIATGYFPPRESPLCGWCDVHWCEFNPKRAK